MKELDFKRLLVVDKEAIDADIASYTKHLKTSTNEQFSQASQQAIEAYCDILNRGGKRLRGALVIEGYKMAGGNNHKMILQAARAIEMIHAYLLIIDDIQDRSQTRRGGPAAYVILDKQFGGQHAGETMATNAALLGNHAAMMILANLDAPAHLRNNVLSILNRTLMITVHGQIADAANSISKTATEADIRDVQEWKTATYSILNPLHVGMVLAGADCHMTDAVTPYAHAVGQAFQITDDIIGVFGNNGQTGKDNIDDIREGKQTLLSVYALQHVDAADKKFLQASLGNPSLTAKEFKRCQQIIADSGACNFAQDKAAKDIQTAINSLQPAKNLLSSDGYEFLLELARSLQNRIS